ncbi:MAG: inositol monophosphatase family protein [Bacteroidales bacterium]|jgi:myo-inositol-1(or 4)-monophosphatase|nr:inositol monophosphatase [Bacteroidales bacterium]MDD3700387.1 inositol monophosphatase family protein [Bacteroidales bacterium]MDY0368727.1 inositol monophosphatase family protein [Bacteroidales bacterium]
MNLETIMDDAVSLARLTAEFIRQEASHISRIPIESKGVHNLVSYVDRQAEQQLITGLQKILPGSGFIAEESGAAKADTYNWIIDPLDGTTNFLHGVPVYSISIALQEHDELLLGIVLEIGRDECFYACKSSPCYLNGVEVRVSDSLLLDQSLLATGFPYYDYSRMQPYLRLFENLMRHTRGVRRLGSAAVDLAYVAAGRFDAFYEYGLNPWDIAAGIVLVQQAGGSVTTFDGSQNVLYGKDILASNSHIHDAMLTEIKNTFD